MGIMFGYATDETESCMPLTIDMAHNLNRRLASARKSGEIGWARPDTKTQVTVEYEDDHSGALVPVRVHTVVISTQHDEEVTLEQIRKDMMDNDTVFHLNPSGRFVIGGPQGDAGVTGRKIIVDTYGGWGAHGGGAFSGKDFTKVDRSAAYAARWVAKSLVKAKLCRRVLVQISYAIGIAEPLSLFVNSYGTGTKPDEELTQIVKNNFDLRPGVIVKDLKLKQPIFRETAKYGHFGRDEFEWEKPEKIIL